MLERLVLVDGIVERVGLVVGLDVGKLEPVELDELAVEPGMVVGRLEPSLELEDRLVVLDPMAVVDNEKRQLEHEKQHEQLVQNTVVEQHEAVVVAVVVVEPEHGQLASYIVMEQLEQLGHEQPGQHHNHIVVGPGQE